MNAYNSQLQVNYNSFTDIHNLQITTPKIKASGMSSPSMLASLSALYYLIVVLNCQFTGYHSQSSELLYDWQFTANQFVLASCPLRIMARDFSQLHPCGHSPFLKPLILDGSHRRHRFQQFRYCCARIRHRDTYLMSRYLAADDISVIMSRVASYILHVNTVEWFQMWKENR
jgi:hypothetical protein